MSDDDELGGNPRTIVVAILANLAIMVAKAITATISGSAGMLAEAVHSGIDTANQIVFLIGIRRSRNKADPTHPFGYGKEVYFWALVYGVMLLMLGGGVSVYQGVTRLLEPEPPGGFTYSYIVLAVAFVAEAWSWQTALRAIHREEKGDTLFEKVKRCRDPSRFVVIGEDSAALTGVVAAALGLALTQATGSPIPDAVASIVIGVILAAAALFLTNRAKEALIGEATDHETIARIEEITTTLPQVVDVGTPFTMRLGPNDLLVGLDVHFQPYLSADQVARAVDDIEAAVRDVEPSVTRIFVEPQRRDEDLEHPEDDVPEQFATTNGGD